MKFVFLTCLFISSSAIAEEVVATAQLNETQAVVTFTNFSGNTINYQGFSSSPRLVLQELKGSNFETEKKFFCGTGSRSYRIEPGHSITSIIDRPSGNALFRTMSYFTTKSDTRNKVHKVYSNPFSGTSYSNKNIKTEPARKEGKTVDQLLDRMLVEEQSPTTSANQSN